MIKKLLLLLKGRKKYKDASVIEYQKQGTVHASLMKMINAFIARDQEKKNTDLTPLQIQL